MDRDVSYFSANVRRGRTERGMSQQRLADEAGLSRATIASIEGGRYESADTATVQAIARVFGVEPGELLRPDPARSPVAPYVDEFLASPWRDAVKPTDEEIKILRELPEVVWFGIDRTAEALAKFLLWRRGQERKPE